MTRLFERIADKFRVKLREKIGNPLLGGGRRKRLNNSAFTIISNNCWGGHVYRFFDAPYDSPTVGLYFFSEDYLKFVGRLKHYLDTELRFITAEESRWREMLERRHETRVPIGVLDDVEVIFLHCKTPEEAREKWNRRKARIHWDNLFFKMTEQNLCTPDHLKAFDALPLRNKFVFTHKDYGLASQVVCHEWSNHDEVANDTLHFRKYVDLIKWINHEPYKRKQTT